ncbi:hypothetical protein ABEKA_2874 [Acinetobacter lwoffii]|jgi:hypothetical protein|nr:hypothetical protein ABEKA_2874 [Acinetobacter lwoffii]
MEKDALLYKILGCVAMLNGEFFKGVLLKINGFVAQTYL